MCASLDCKSSFTHLSVISADKHLSIVASFATKMLTHKENVLRYHETALYPTVLVLIVNSPSSLADKLFQVFRNSARRKYLRSLKCILDFILETVPEVACEVAKNQVNLRMRAV